MRRVAELDGLRGIAVLMIVALHLGLSPTMPFLASAVDLFFVLSGYLITRIILDRPPSAGFLKAFYARRILRIWPIYFLLILGFLVVNRALHLRQRTAGWPYYLTFTQFTPRYWFVLPPKFCDYLSHTWTLAAEEQFYLIWPLLAVVLGRRGLLWSIPVLVGSAFAARLIYAPILLATNWDGFALGGLLAWMLGEPGSARAKRPAMVASLAALGTLTALYPLFSGGIEGWFVHNWPSNWGDGARSLNALRIFLLYFSIVGVVVCLTGSRLLAPLRHPCLVYLGAISYGLYLYHVPVFVILSPALHHRMCHDSMALDALKLAVSFVVAVLSWEFLEKPILGWKDRFPYPAPATVPVARSVPQPHFRGDRGSAKIGPDFDCRSD